jgi:outer membrane protein assembly factor BamA
MNSRKEDRTNYRLEDFRSGGNAGIRLDDHVKAGVHLDWIETNVGKGTDPRSPSIEPLFGATDLAALDKQPRYLETGAFMEFDSRDETNNPHSGGHYSAKWSRFLDQGENRYGFDQFDAEAQQYFPFLNNRRVIALRGKTTLTRTADGQEIPFFMQPTLGGSEDLRGFTEFRFRDRNLVVMNAEYRWEAFAGLDLALFADAGQVASTVHRLDLGAVKTAAGVGFRFNTAKSVFRASGSATGAATCTSSNSIRRKIRNWRRPPK